MTLSEMAAAKAAAFIPPPIAESAQKKSAGIVIKQATASDRSYRNLPTREEQPSLPSSCNQGERLLGTENLLDVIPNFPPKSTNPERLWQQACLLPQSCLGVILSNQGHTAWIALTRPGHPPLLLSPFQVLGRLPEVPLDPMLPE